MSVVDDEGDGCVVEEEDILMYSWTQDAILNRQLLTLLPLIYEYFAFIGTEAIKARCSNTVKLLIRYYQVKFEMKRRKQCPPLQSTKSVRAKMLMRLALEDTFRETLSPDFYSECVMSMDPIMNDSNSEKDDEKSDKGPFTEDAVDVEVDEDEKRISASRSKEDQVLARPIDDDDNLPPGVSLVYRSISSQIRGLYAQFNSICTKVGLNYKASDHNVNTSASYPSTTASDLTPRKVRPITQVAASDLKEQRIQKQLRQWFWWRYGSQKDLIDALNNYILEQLLFPLFPIMNQDKNQVNPCLKNCKNVNTPLRLF